MVRYFPVLVFLPAVACVAEVEGTAQVDPDSTSDSADVAAELPTLAPCEGADFTSTVEWWLGNPAWYARYYQSDLFQVWLALEASSAATGCPTRDVGLDGSVTFTGDCSADGVTFAGTWVELDEPSGYEVEGVTVELSDHDPPISFTGDGTFIQEYTTEGGVHVGVTESVDGSYVISSGGDLDGDFTFANLQVTRNQNAYTASGAMEVHWPYGDGIYCPTVDLHTVASCPEEPDGFVALQGADTMIAVANGSVACDGCVDVYTNGVEVDPVCDFPDVFY